MGSLTQGTAVGVMQVSPNGSQTAGPLEHVRAQDQECAREPPLQATAEYIMKDWDAGAVVLWSDKLKTLIPQNFSISVSMTLFIAKVDEVWGHWLHIGIFSSSQRYELILSWIYALIGLPRWLSDKESTCQCRRLWFSPWVGKIPWRRKQQPAPVFLPGKSHGQRSLVGYSP